jgi:hypothetical protein
VITETKGELFARLNDIGNGSFLGLSVFLVALYAFKMGISLNLKTLDVRLFAYFVLVHVSLPIIYLNWTEWSNDHVTIRGNWLGLPIGLLMIPAMSFAHDLFHPELAVRSRIIRTLIEFIVLIPIWFVVWTFAGLYLGHVWI